ncbi:hypothetical protein [Companilactobacillus bobalius]|nr:hypothetical protein [Companilactobacillus bobalius]
MFSKLKDFYHSKTKSADQPQTVVRADQIEQQQEKMRMQERRN